MTQSLVFHLDLLEPLLFGDNRTGELGQASMTATDPTPLTIFGAIGSFLLERFPSALGPIVTDILSADSKSGTAELLAYWYRTGDLMNWFPKPEHLRCSQIGGRLFATDVIVPAKMDHERCRTSLGSKYLLSAEKDMDECDVQGILVSQSMLGDLLTGQRLQDPTEIMMSRELYRAESRVGIAMDSDQNRPIEGILFRRPYRRYDDGSTDDMVAPCAIGLKLRCPKQISESELVDDVGFLGGDRKRVRVRQLEEEEDPIQVLRNRVKEVDLRDSQGYFLYYLTPTIVDEVSGVEDAPTALARGKSLRISGWNTRGWPRPMETVMPAGAVSFFEWPDARIPQPDEWAALVDQFWLASNSPRGSAAGFGRTLVGVWGQSR